MDKQDIISADNWHKSYKLKTSSNLWGEGCVPYVHDAIKLFKNNPRGKIYLDLPCGDGRNLIELCRNLPFVVGADYSLNALEIADIRLRSGLNDNFILQICDIFKTGYNKDQFDGIFCWDILGHLVNVEDAINELLRILKPGGKLIGSLFSTNDSTKEDKKMLSIGDNEFKYDDKFYFKYYELDSLKELLIKIKATNKHITLAKWTEGPHEGYREYIHDHESWVFVLEKTPK